MYTTIHSRVLACLIIVILSAAYCTAQTAATDTLATAKQKMEQGKYKAAIRLLKAYHANHPTDINAAWSYAHSAYLVKDYKTSSKMFGQSFYIKQPADYNLVLDYAQMLAYKGDYDSAKAILNHYQNDPTKSGAHLLLARIFYWQGDYQQATTITRQVLKVNANNQKAKDLMTEILQAKSAWLKLQGAFETDDQPLKTITPTAEAGIFLHTLGQLHFSLSSPIHLRDGNTYQHQWLQADNTFHFIKPVLDINIGAGLLRQVNGGITWTGKLSIAKTFKQYLVLSSGAERQPYYFTRASLDANLTPYRYTASIVWNDWNDWNGGLQGAVTHFTSDNNFIFNTSTWVISPPLKASVFEFRLGYGYSFTTTKDVKYTSVKTLNDLIANYDTTAKIAGQYNPYFTPKNQSIHSAIVAIAIHPAKTFDINLNGNIGFYSTNETPYLYLDKSTDGQTIIASGFAKSNYLPLELKAAAIWRITPKISLKAEYAYTQTYFYNSNYAGLGIKMSFWNGKKAQ